MDINLYRFFRSILVRFEFNKCQKSIQYKPFNSSAVFNVYYLEVKISDFFIHEFMCSTQLKGGAETDGKTCQSFLI